MPGPERCGEDRSRSQRKLQKGGARVRRQTELSVKEGDSLTPAEGSLNPGSGGGASPTVVLNSKKRRGGEKQGKFPWGLTG